jgi:hypothetical protein
MRRFTALSLILWVYGHADEMTSDLPGSTAHDIQGQAA